MTAIDLKLTGGKPVSWEALAPSVGEQLELAAETYGQALSEGLNEDAIKSLYEELPKLTDLMLAQIPQGISPSTYCVFVALLLDQENTYNYLRLDDLPVLRVFLSRADFLRVHFKIIPRGGVQPQGPGEKAIAMSVLVRAYAMTSMVQRELTICDGYVFIPTGLPSVISQFLGVGSEEVVLSRQRISMLLWVPPLKEVPSELIEAVRRLGTDEGLERICTWLRGYAQLDEEYIHLVAQIVARDLSLLT